MFSFLALICDNFREKGFLLVVESITFLFYYSRRKKEEGRRKKEDAIKRMGLCN
jgi:hypothetical protein